MVTVSCDTTYVARNRFLHRVKHSNHMRGNMHHSLRLRGIPPLHRLLSQLRVGGEPCDFVFAHIQYSSGLVSYSSSAVAMAVTNKFPLDLLSEFQFSHLFVLNLVGGVCDVSCPLGGVSCVFILAPR